MGQRERVRVREREREREERYSKFVLNQYRNIIIFILDCV